MQEDYKQAQFTMTDATAQILSGKHSQTVKYKKCKEVRVQRDLSHNRTKRYILPEGTPEQVEEAVKSVKESLWAGGGCIAQCEFGPGARPENVEAVFRAWSRE